MGRRYTYEEYLREFAPDELHRLEQSRKAETAEETANEAVTKEKENNGKIDWTEH